MAKLVSKTYGEALFELAMEENKSQLLLEEVQELIQVLEANPDFDKLMKHPGIAKQEKVETMKNVFKGRVCDELVGFLEVVLMKGRYGELPAIFDYFIEKMKEVSKIGIAHVTTAVELTEAQKADVEKRLLETTSYETMEMHFQVDNSIIGGMIIRIKDRVVDSSIRTKIDDLTKQLLQIQLG